MPDPTPAERANLPTLIAQRKRIAALEAALREIVKCESRYVHDPLERATYAVEHMQFLARQALGPSQPPAAERPVLGVAGRHSLTVTTPAKEPCAHEFLETKEHPPTCVHCGTVDDLCGTCGGKGKVRTWVIDPMGDPCPACGGEA